MRLFGPVGLHVLSVLARPCMLPLDHANCQLLEAPCVRADVAQVQIQGSDGTFQAPITIRPDTGEQPP